MSDFIFPTSEELSVIAAEKQVRLINDAGRPRLGLQIMPTRAVDAAMVAWEQMDNAVGLQGVRGIGGNPTRVNRIGFAKYNKEPGYYGEFIALDEEELTLRRRIGTAGVPININDLVIEALDQLLIRRLDRIEHTAWQALVYGNYAVSNSGGPVLAEGVFPIQTYAGSDWSSPSTATPLADFRAVGLLGAEHGASFGAGAMAVMNKVTFNYLMANTNSADLGGRRLNGLVPVNDKPGLMALMAGDDLPMIVVYDEGYNTDANVFTRFIPNDKVMIRGVRPAGQKISEYLFTRNLSAPGEVGAYSRVIDRGPDRIPRLIEVHDGHNGGPVIYFPGSICTMSV